MNRTPWDNLRQVYQQESRTLFQYARQARLVCLPKDRPHLTRLNELANQEAALLQEMGQLLLDHRCSISTGCFPPVFTNYNYVDFSKMLPKLIAEHQARLTVLGKVESEGLIATLTQSKQANLAEMLTWLEPKENAT